MPSLVILGAGGFLGKAIITYSDGLIPIKAIVRKQAAERALDNIITWYEADLLIPQSLDSILEKNDIVINTTYIPSNSKKDNLLLIDNIIASCAKRGVKRLIHCSTANVVGDVNNLQIDESTICKPVTEYERVKFDIEQYILNSAASDMEVVILRPAAIVGPGGKNLAKLANSLIHGNPFVNYLRASLFKKRQMHLVPVHNVVAAIWHMCRLDKVAKGSIYFISSDDDRENTFFGIEKILQKALGLKNRKIPLLPIPLFFLFLLLRLKGQCGSDVSRVYKSDKLLDIDYIPVDSLHNAIHQFGAAFISAHNQECN